MHRSGERNFQREGTEYKEAVENLRWPRGRLPGWLKANELGRGQKEEAGAPGGAQGGQQGPQEILECVEKSLEEVN